jgi:hypothetical protein
MSALHQLLTFLDRKSSSLHQTTSLKAENGKFVAFNALHDRNGKPAKMPRRI